MSENNLTELIHWHTEAWGSCIHIKSLPLPTTPRKKQSSEMQARKHIQRIP